MSRNRNAVVSMISCSLVIIAGGLNAQEVNSDVKVPPPREVVISAPRVGLFGGQGGTDVATGQAFQATLTPTSAGTMTRGEARGQVGDFMVSLLMKAGLVSFDNVAARTAGSQSGSPEGVRPAWLGSVPLGPSVAPGRVDSPPTSMMSAPSSTIRIACSMAVAGST